MVVRFRHKGWYGVVLILPLLVWLSNGIQSSSSESNDGFRLLPGSHPIDQLSARAALKWDNLLKGQSKTLEEAVGEYKRRYRRKPPRGFDEWYNWATEHGLKLVDEFDNIDDNLLPFWGLSADQIESRRQEMIKSARSDRLFTLQIRDGVISDDPEGLASTTRWPINKHYYALVDGIAQFLPDVDITVNLYDIPLIYVSLEERERLMALGRAGKFASDEEHEAVAARFNRRDSDMSLKDLRRICPASSPIWETVTDAFGEVTLSPSWKNQELAFRLPAELGAFIHDHEAAMDLCLNPELKDQHGNFLTTRKLSLGFKRNYLYPVFSWTRYPRSSDILIPTSYRFEFKKPNVNDWGERRATIAWRGTMTGMDALDNADSFASQRFRLMDMMESPYASVPIYVAINISTTGYSMTSVQSGPLNEEWMEVGISGKPDGLGGSKTADVARAKFHFLSWMRNEDRNAHKILLDVDGWGWSARFRDLLWSGSAVLKSTVFHEATTNWLIPWYHYIPLDYAYQDLYSIALYYFGLKGTDQQPHDDALRKIGEQGRAWVDEHAQWDQHLAYMYRLILEWARIMSDRSPEWDYQG